MYQQTFKIQLMFITFEQTTFFGGTLN